ncbi:MAG TPA: DUF4907 domain-containing protein [Puia sp.]|jgi:hypothetical protein|nr:DUF4907 domain-containing protein [Puia sp.]
MTNHLLSCLIPAATAVILLLPSCAGHPSPAAADTSYVVKICDVDNGGFGYVIWQGDRQVINQPHIPAIQHNLAFRSRKEAEITALLVKQKLQAHQFPPTITIRELDSLQIHY